jgi:hypothetical protein
MKPDFWQKNSREIRPGNHKSTKKWCKGKLGKQHKVELVVPPNIPGWKREGCRWASWQCKDGYRFYLCNHVWICTECGKHVKDTKRTDCPDFHEYVEPVESW